MKKSITLSVPEPCHENWNEMTPAEKGRHCAVCDKTVVDFTRKTDREIAKIVKGGASLCGRFKKEQLDKPIPLPRKRDVFFELVSPSYAASLLIPVAIFGTQHLHSQKTSNTQTESTYATPKPDVVPQKRLQGKIAIHSNELESFLLKGTVSDENGPLPGANVVVKGTDRGKQTDFDGNYEIRVNKEETIVISFVGYETQEILINTTKNNRIDTVLRYDGDIMGDIIIVGMIATEPDVLNMTPPLEFSQSEERKKAKEEEKIHLQKVNAYQRYKKEQKRLSRKRNKQ